MTKGGEAYRTLRFTPTFLDTLAGKNFGVQERRAFIKALSLLDGDETHPSLRVHQLRASLAGIWSASVWKPLRMTFIRDGEGLKIMLDLQPPLR